MKGEGPHKPYVGRSGLPPRNSGGGAFALPPKRFKRGVGGHSPSHHAMHASRNREGYIDIDIDMLSTVRALHTLTRARKLSSRRIKLPPRFQTICIARNAHNHFQVRARIALPVQALARTDLMPVVPVLGTCSGSQSTVSLACLRPPESVHRVFREGYIYIYKTFRMQNLKQRVQQTTGLDPPETLQLMVFHRTEPTQFKSVTSTQCVPEQLNTTKHGFLEKIRIGSKT